MFCPRDAAKENKPFSCEAGGKARKLGAKSAADESSDSEGSMSDSSDLSLTTNEFINYQRKKNVS